MNLFLAFSTYRQHKSHRHNFWQEDSSYGGRSNEIKNFLVEIQ
jgi:hypothetical protein